MKKLVALLCAALFFIMPMTAYAEGVSLPSRVPDIGEAVTAYTKADYILNFSDARFSVMDANGNEQNGSLAGLDNVMKIWVHTADGQTFSAYCLDMTEHYPPTVAAGQEGSIAQLPQNYATVAWPAGPNYDKMLWVVEHTYPAIPIDTMMSDAEANFSRLVSEIQAAQNISAAEAERLAENAVYATVQQAIWHHQPALIKGTDGMYVGARMLNGNQDLKLLYAYLTKERAEYRGYRNARIGKSIRIEHPADMTPAQEGTSYVFGPFAIGTDMLSAGDAQLAYTGAGSLAIRFTDTSGNAISSVRQGQPFYLRTDGVPTEPITISVSANTANAVTMDANRGRMYAPADGGSAQPVGTGGVPKTVSASASLTLPTVNPPAPPVKAGGTVKFKKTDEKSGAALQGAVIRIDDSAGKKVWQGETDANGIATTDVEILYDTDYTYYEVTAPKGYELDSARHTLRISGKGGDPEYWAFTNRPVAVETPPALADVTLKKVDEHGRPLEGATIKVLDASGKEVFSGKTDKYGKVVVRNLSSGFAYTYFESAAPAGYDINGTRYSFTVDKAGNVSRPVDIVNKKSAVPTPTPAAIKPVMLPPKTGDTCSGGISACMIAAALCAAAAACHRRNREGESYE